MQTITFPDYMEAKLYAQKMREQGYKARIRPRSNKWQVVLRVKGETGMPDGKGTESLSDAMGDRGGIGGGIMGSKGTYQEKLYRVPSPQQVTMPPEEPVMAPATPATDVGRSDYRQGDYSRGEYGAERTVYSGYEAGFEQGTPAPRIRGRTPDISLLRGKPPNLSILTKKAYLKDSPDEDGQGGM